jgi:hypothetical protein
MGTTLCLLLQSNWIIISEEGELKVKNFDSASLNKLIKDNTYYPLTSLTNKKRKC